MAKDEIPYKVILGLAITTAIGASLLSYVKTSPPRTNVLQKIGNALSNVGGMLDNGETMGKELSNEVGNSPQDLISQVMNWASTGMNLWNNLKKGR